MLQALKEETNKTRTENGAASLRSTGSDCLDLFAVIGSLRHEEASRIETKFLRAFAEDPTTALRILFFTRDIKEGLGEHRIARILYRFAAHHCPAALLKNISHISLLGRYDDLLTLLHTPLENDAIALIKKQLDQDLIAASQEKSVSLLGKWLPSANTSSPETVRAAKHLQKALKLSAADYRKILSLLRRRIRIIENNLREKDYTFDYETIPGCALYKYRDAFLRNDDTRYDDFLQRAAAGKAKINTATLYPYDFIHTIRHTENIGADTKERASLDTMWNRLPDFTQKENALVVVDDSASMYYGCHSAADPIDIAISLAIYYAERNKGHFHNYYLSFSERPELLKIQGADLYEKVRCILSHNEIANTNLAAVFDLILDAAIHHHIPQEEFPKTLYLISDMEFDAVVRNADETNFEYAKERFTACGYRLPHIVFWNVNARNEQVPVKQNEENVTLVSGISPHLFQFITSENKTPYDFMMKTLSSERYREITA